MKDIDQFKRGYNTQESMSYLGVKRKSFEKYFRPYLTPIKFGTSIIYDVIDLDSLLEDYKGGNERLITEKGETKWAENKVASTKTTKVDGASIKSIEGLDFESVSKHLKTLKTG